MPIRRSGSLLARLIHICVEAMLSFAKLALILRGCAELNLDVQLHQVTMAREEFEALRGVREARATSGAPSHAVCLMAIAATSHVPDASPLLQIDSANSSGSSTGAPSSGGETVVGSLDLCNVRAVAGEVLIGACCAELALLSSELCVMPGKSRADLQMMQLLPTVAGDSSNIAYLANVCVSEAARRCRIGEALIQHARQLAQSWGESWTMPASSMLCRT